MSNKPPALDMHLCFKLYSASLKMTQLYKPLLASLNLTYPQYLVMLVLWEEEGIGMKELAERLGLDAGSVTPLVNRLEANGYVVRSRSALDERSRVLTLTEAAHALRETANEVSHAIISQCAITSSTAENLMGKLDILNGNLNAALAG